jgi:hypothetical protein
MKIKSQPLQTEERFAAVFHFRPSFVVETAHSAQRRDFDTEAPLKNAAATQGHQST